MRRNKAFDCDRCGLLVDTARNIDRKSICFISKEFAKPVDYMKQSPRFATEKYDGRVNIRKGKWPTAGLVTKMDNETNEKIRKKQKYNGLLFAITKYGLLNRKPPEQLIEQARELGRQLDIAEEELKNIEYSIGTFPGDN